ncbi:MAG: hypothetical protein QXH30_01935 [Candidatus Bilamarchaeaceae archaeon]
MREMKKGGDGGPGRNSEGKVSPAPPWPGGLAKRTNGPDFSLLAKAGDSGDIPAGLQQIGRLPKEKSRASAHASEKPKAGFLTPPLLSGSFHDSEAAPELASQGREDSRLTDLRKFCFDD